MKKFIITLNRECGSGGSEIASLLGKKLGVKVYGRELLETIAKEYNLSIEEMDRIKARKTSWWNDFCRFYTQFGAASHINSDEPQLTPKTLYYAEERILRDLAEKDSCIIVGRAGFHIFRNSPNALHLLITAQRDARIQHVAKKHGIGIEQAAARVDRIDKERETFTKSVTETSRYDARNYDFVFNVTGMTPETVAEFLAQSIRHKFDK